MEEPDGAGGTMRSQRSGVPRHMAVDDRPRHNTNERGSLIIQTGKHRAGRNTSSTRVDVRHRTESKGQTKLWGCLHLVTSCVLSDRIAI